MATCCTSRVAAPGQRVNLAQAVDLVAKKLDAEGHVLGVGRPDLNHIAAHAEAVALKRNVVALVLDLDELAQHLVAVFLHARAQRDDHVLVVDRVAQRIDA